MTTHTPTRWRPERRTLIVLALLVGVLLLLPSGGRADDAPFTPDTRSAPRMTSVVASVYGPGLWGNHVACSYRGPYGEFRLKRTTWGVAHRSLPCGTIVTICSRRCVTVPVIDRGPYVHGRTFDLTLRPALVACQCSTWQQFGVRTVRYRRGR